MQYLVELIQYQMNANSFESLIFLLSVHLFNTDSYRDSRYIFDKVLHISKFSILTLQNVDPPPMLQVIFEGGRTLLSNEVNPLKI